MAFHFLVAHLVRSVITHRIQRTLVRFRIKALADILCSSVSACAANGCHKMSLLDTLRMRTGENGCRFTVNIGEWGGVFAG